MLSYRPDIDGLRAVAILLVMLYHAFPNLVQGGFAGVDVFFVISGFLISSLLFRGFHDGSFAFPDFYLRRVRRLFPALIVVLAAALLLGWALMLPFELKGLGRHVGTGALFIANFKLWREMGYFDENLAHKPLMHLWSLGVEQQFYLMFPFFLWALKRTGVGLFRGVAGAALVSLAVQIFISPQSPGHAFFLPHARLWELLAGSLLAHAALHFRRPLSPVPTENLAGAAGLFLILFGALSFEGGDGFHLGRLVVPVVGTALAIAAGPTAWTNRRILSHPGLIWIGKISYPLYLWHWLLLSFATILCLELPPWWLRLARLIFATGLAWLTFEKLERPIRNGARYQRSPVLLASLLAAIGLAGFQIYRKNGVVVRPPITALSYLSPDPLQRHDWLAGNPRYYSSLWGRRISVIFAGDCHMRADSARGPFTGVAAKCLTLHAKKPNVLVIGDSTGGGMAAALRHADLGLNVLQITGVGCHPSMRYTAAHRQKYCADIYRYVEAFVATNDLQAIILTVNWSDGQHERTGAAPFLARLREIAPRVIVAGPPLKFTVPAPLFLGRRRPKEDMYAIANRFRSPTLRRTNELIRQYAADHGVEYLDRYRILCPEEKCPLVAESGESYFVDAVHLSHEGIRYFGNRLREIGFWNAPRKVASGVIKPFP